MNEINAPSVSKINASQFIGAIGVYVAWKYPQYIPFVDTLNHPDVQALAIAVWALFVQFATFVFRTWFTAKRPKL